MRLPRVLTTRLLRNDYAGLPRGSPARKGAQNASLSSDASHTKNAPATTRPNENQMALTSNRSPRHPKPPTNKLGPVAVSSSTCRCPRMRATKKVILPRNSCETRSAPQSTRPSVSSLRTCGSNSTTSPTSTFCSSSFSRYATPAASAFRTVLTSPCLRFSPSLAPLILA
jgi:hypothetical protein